MKRDHSEIEALIAVGALGGLDANGEQALARERAEHGTDCEECLRLERAYVETAGTLAFGLDPVPVRAGLEEAVVRRATAPDRVAPQPLRSVGAARRLVAAAVAAVLLLAGFAAGFGLKSSGLTSSEQALRALLVERGTRVVHLSGSGPGNLAIAYRPGDPNAFLLAADLVAAPDGKTYELWRIGGQGPLASGCFEPSRGSVIRQVPAPDSGSTVAVTIEPSCAQKPSTKPILSTSIR